MGVNVGKKKILVMGASLGLFARLSSILEKEYDLLTVVDHISVEDVRPALEDLYPPKSVNETIFKHQRREYENITFRKRNNFRPRFSRTKN